MSERLTERDLIRFAYGQADELEAVILADDEYISSLERIWASEMKDLTEPTLKAIHLERLFTEGALAALDTGERLMRAAMHYLAGPGEESESDAVSSIVGTSDEPG